MTLIIQFNKLVITPKELSTLSDYIDVQLKNYHE